MTLLLIMSINILLLLSLFMVTKLQTPDDESCTSLGCVDIYYKGVKELEKNISGLGKLKRFLEKMKMKSTEHEGEIDTEECEPNRFFKKLKTFLSNLGRNCK